MPASSESLPFSGSTFRNPKSSPEGTGNRDVATKTGSSCIASEFISPAAPTGERQEPGNWKKNLSNPGNNLAQDPPLKDLPQAQEQESSSPQGIDTSIERQEFDEQTRRRPLEIYEKAPISGRTAWELARRHGFKSVKKFADSLPQNAHVLDVGAGVSTFGKEVAILRPDITWTNFDIKLIVQKDSPTNVYYIQGDATKLGELYKPKTFDAVLSYWLFPHLSIDDEEPAIEAAKELFKVAKNGGLLSVGPRRNIFSLFPCLPNSYKIHKDDNRQGEEEYARQVLKETRLNPVIRIIQKVTNEIDYQGNKEFINSTWFRK